VNTFVRVKVKLDIRKALARFVMVVCGGQRDFYPIKFEKINKFCGACVVCLVTFIWSVDRVNTMKLNWSEEIVLREIGRLGMVKTLVATKVEGGVHEVEVLKGLGVRGEKKEAWGGDIGIWKTGKQS
jgi:hypothetical protein